MIEARIRQSILAYVDAWNEHDEKRRWALIEECTSEDIRIIAPREQRISGRRALDALIVDFHSRRAGDRGRLSSEIEIHGTIFRFAARIEGSATVPPIEMLDAGECDALGRISLILSFVGAAPSALKDPSDR